MRTILAITVVMLCGCGRAAPPPKPAWSPTPPPPPGPAPEQPSGPGFEIGEACEMVMKIASSSADGEWRSYDCVHEHEGKSGRFRVRLKVGDDVRKKPGWKREGIGRGEVEIVRLEAADSAFLLKRLNDFFMGGLPNALPAGQTGPGKFSCPFRVWGARLKKNPYGYVPYPSGGPWVFGTGEGAGEYGRDLFYLSVNEEAKELRIAAYDTNATLASGETAMPAFAKALQ